LFQHKNDLIEGQINLASMNHVSDFSGFHVPVK